jgi:hypothetical protein
VVSITKGGESPNNQWGIENPGNKNPRLEEQQIITTKKKYQP